MMLSILFGSVLIIGAYFFHGTLKQQAHEQPLHFTLRFIRQPPFGGSVTCAGTKMDIKMIARKSSVIIDNNSSFSAHSNENSKKKNSFSRYQFNNTTFTNRLYGKQVLTCILDQLPDQILEIQAFAVCHVELIYCRRSAYLVDNFVRIQGISLYQSSLNRIDLLKKVRDHRNVFCMAVVAFGLLLFLPKSAEELFVTFD